MGNRTEDARRDGKDDIYFRILLLLVAYYVRKNLKVIQSIVMEAMITNWIKNGIRLE